MEESTIVYGFVSIEIDRTTAYLLRKAGIEPGTDYVSHLFIKKIKEFSDNSDRLDESERESIERMINHAKITDCITVKRSNEKTLATIINVE